MYDNPQEVKELIMQLVSVESISGTPGELTMAATIFSIIKEIPYFQTNPEQVQQHPLPGDSLGRSFITALVRGSRPSPRTIVLLSHFDVVGIEDYGQLKEYAFRPELYTQKLIQQIADLGDEAGADLSSGDWLFGRGIMDMKAGLGIQIAALSQLADECDFAGNILLLATPDEERNSAGMLAAVTELGRLQAELNLKYTLCICSESSFASYPGDIGKYIYTGSVGKLLPVIYCVGQETHVGEPMEGINATWMAAKIVQNMEWSDLFVDDVEDEICPPPTCLKLTDLKQEYNVQTPNSAYVLYNVLTFHQTPAEVMAKVRQVAEQASAEIRQTLSRKYANLLIPSMDKERKINDLCPSVFTYSELLQRGEAQFGETLTASLQNIIDTGKNKCTDYRELCVTLATELSSYFAAEGPFYLLMLAPPYYPHVYWEHSDRTETRLPALLNHLTEQAEIHKEALHIRTFFPGLSDVSYCHLKDPDEVISTLEANMPLLGTAYNLPLQQIASLDMPTINIGPYGKDAHKHTERLNISFSTEVTPHLLLEAIRFVLEAD